MKMALVVLLGVLMTVPAAAEAPKAALITERATRLADWIVSNSDYGPMKRQPIYIFVSTDELRYIRGGGLANVSSGQETPAAVALYFNGVVFLQENFTLGLDDDVLVHELVHHLQSEQERPYPCVQARERDAYALQAEFVKQTGIGELPNPMWAFVASQCVY